MTDPDFLRRFAQHLGTDPEQAAEALRQVSDALGASLQHTSRADVPGLGAFRVVKGHVAFVPVAAVAHEVNARYAGLEEVASPLSPVPQPPDTPSEDDARDGEAQQDEEEKEDAQPQGAQNEGASERSLVSLLEEDAATPDAEPAGAPDEWDTIWTSPEATDESAEPDRETEPKESAAQEESASRASAPPAEALPLEEDAPEILPPADGLATHTPSPGPEPEELEPAELDGVWAPADEPNAQPLGPTADDQLEDAQFDVVAVTSPASDQPEGEIEEVEVEVEEAAPAEPASSGLVPQEVKQDWTVPRVRRKKTRVKAKVVSRDFLRERREKRQQEVQSQRDRSDARPPSDPPEHSLSRPAETAEASSSTEAPPSTEAYALKEAPTPKAAPSAFPPSMQAGEEPAPVDAEPADSETAPSEPASEHAPAPPPPTRPTTMPAAVAALQSSPASAGDSRRRVAERRQETNWMLPAILGGALVLALVAWAASHVGDAPPDDPPVAALGPAPAAQPSADGDAQADGGAEELPPEAAAENAAPDDPADPFDVPLRSAGAVEAQRGGFTWVVTREGTPPAEQAASYRAAGYRAGVLRSEVDGRTIERVCLGQFRTADDALAARPDLPERVPADRWLLRIPL